MMKVKIGETVGDYRTVWMEDSVVKLINQPLLPHRFEIYKSTNYGETSDAIRNMIVRGAPAIGATAAFGVAQGALRFRGDDMEEFRGYMTGVGYSIKESRPTAYDLFYAVDMMIGELGKAESVRDAKDILVKASNEYADRSVEFCRRIGLNGEKLIHEGIGILTHCNAGALACVDYGTALSPMRLAKSNGKRFHVFVDETRPRCQGSRLTAWELMQEDIDHSIVADNAAGYFMRRGEVDMVIVGADRIALNGDIANKIGTYEKAVLAKENNIPFYVAAPVSTIDLSCCSGGEIQIEERSEDEIHSMWGLSDSGKIRKIRISPQGSKAKNPSFDVTPHRYVTGIITEEGIYKPGKLKSVYK